MTGPGRWPRSTACAMRLRDELGVDPSTEVGAAAAGAARAPVPGSRPAARGTPRAGSRAGGRSAAWPSSGGTRSWPGCARRSAAREVVALGGVAGAGKSRLAAEATRDGAVPVLAARAFLPERGEAWGLARSVLREALALDAHVVDGLAPRVRAALAGLLPELDGPDVALDGETPPRARARRRRRSCWPRRSATARCSSSTTCSGPTRAAAPSSRPRWPGCPGSRPCSPSGPTRPSSCPSVADRPGRALAAAPSRAVVDVALGPLPDDGLAALVADPRLAAALRAATDRTPFAVAEVLRELAVRGVAVAGPDGRWRPRGRRRRRAGRRARPRRGSGGPCSAAPSGRPVRAPQVLALVALLARETTARTVATAAGLDPRAALDALSGLATAGLVRLGEQGWATAHDLVGETVTAALAPGERGRLHGLLAAALEADDADPAEVARHHRDAGDGTAAAAAFERAARRALAGYATREAAAHAEAGLAVETRPGLLDARAEARAAHGDVAGALADLQAASTGAVGPRAVTAAVPVGDADHGRA